MKVDENRGGVMYDVTHNNWFNNNNWCCMMKVDENRGMVIRKCMMYVTHNNNGLPVSMNCEIVKMKV